MSGTLLAEWAEEGESDRKELTCEQATLVRATTRDASLRFHAVYQSVSPPTLSSCNISPAPALWSRRQGLCATQAHPLGKRKACEYLYNGRASLTCGRVYFNQKRSYISCYTKTITIRSHEHSCMTKGAHHSPIEKWLFTIESPLSFKLSQ